MSNFEQKHNPCVVCLIEKDGKVLMVENLRGIQKGFCSFPGGKLEKGESLFECVYREVKDETGYSLKKAECLGRFDIEDVKNANSADRFSIAENMHVYVFASKEFSGEFRSAEGEVEAFWVDKDKIPYEKMRENDKVWLPEALLGKKFHKSFFRNESGKLELIEHDDKDVDGLLSIRLKQYEMMKSLKGRY